MIERFLKNWYRFLSPNFQTAHLDYRVNLQPRNEHVAEKPVAKLIASYHDNYIQRLKEIASFARFFEYIPLVKNTGIQTQLHWQNGFMPPLDLMALHYFIRTLQPKRYVEIGSGNSTIMVRETLKFIGASTQLISIDPYPRADIDHLSDLVIRKPLELLKKDEWLWNESLQPGDVLFVDNSHRSFANSDVTVFFTEILPCIPPGVIIHIHDIYLPYDYPQEMCSRYYNEQYLLQTALQTAPEKFTILLPNFYISQLEAFQNCLKKLWEIKNLQNSEKHGGSFWFMKN